MVRSEDGKHHWQSAAHGRGVFGGRGDGGRSLSIWPRHGRSPADYRIFHGEPADLRGVGGILHEALHGRGRGIIQLGLLLLIATPVARVAFAVWGFAEEHDRMYVVFTLIVLVILLYSLLGTRLLLF